MRYSRLLCALFLQAVTTCVEAVDLPGSKPAKDYSASANLQQAFQTLNSPAAAADLALSAEQQEALRAAENSLERAYGSIAPKYFGQPRVEITKEFEQQIAVVRSQLETILRPDQLARLTEIICRKAGPYLFESADVVAELEPSPQQQLKMKQAVADYAERGWRATHEAGLDRPHVVTEEFRAAQHAHELHMQRIADDTIQAILAELDERQRAKYARLVGKPIDIVAVKEQWMRSSTSMTPQPTLPASTLTLPAVPVAP